MSTSTEGQPHSIECKVNPRMILKTSKTKYSFRCPDCEHIWIDSPYNITVNDRGCPYCENRKLCFSTDCERCFEKSFAAHPKSNYIRDANPRMIFKTSTKKYTFNCPDCEHIWQTSVKNIVNDKLCPNHC